MVCDLTYRNGNSGCIAGGAFAFNDDDQDRLIEPAKGRLVFFGSGEENMHQVRRVTTGERFVVSAWFQLRA